MSVSIWPGSMTCSSWQGRRLFIKIDVEGHELPALRGMQRLRANNQVILQVEAFAGEPARALATFMEEIGYRPLDNPGGAYRFANFLFKDMADHS